MTCRPAPDGFVGGLTPERGWNRHLTVPALLLFQLATHAVPSNSAAELAAMELLRERGFWCHCLQQPARGQFLPPDSTNCQYGWRPGAASWRSIVSLAAVLKEGWPCCFEILW